MSDFLSNLRFDPFKFNSILNPHSSSADDNCNLDTIQNFTCDYYLNENLDEAIDTNKCNMSLFHHNIRSLNKHSNDIMNYLSATKHNFHIYGFTETWFNSVDDANLVNINGYTMVNSIRQDRRGGGASLFIDSNIDFEIRSDLEVNCADCDSVFIEINNHGRSKNNIIAVVYRPETVKIEDFFTELTCVFNKLNDENKPAYIMGDYNIDILKHDVVRKANDFVNLIFSHGFLPTIDRPTRVTDHSATLIDNIITNDIVAKIDSGVLITDLSDHFPIFLTSYQKSLVYPSKHNSNSTTKQTRQLKSDNIRGLNNNLSIIQWNDVYHESNCEAAYQVFHDKLSNIYNIHCPIKSTKLSKRKTPRKPWITPGLVKSIHTKDKLYKKYITNRNPENKTNYNKYRNTLNSLLRISKKNHITAELDSHKHNMKKTWQTLNDLLGRNKASKSASHFTDDDGTEVKDPTKIANKFNEFFTNIGPSLAAKIPPPDNINDNICPISNASHSIFLSPATQEEILDVTSTLKASTSCGVDGISSNILRQIMPNIIDPVVYIFNLSISTGSVPSPLKVAKVIPIFKAGDKHSFSNYRPISILPALSKVLEKLIYSRIIKFLNKYNILSDNQFGFRAKHSTYMAINKLYDKITTALDQKLCTVGIFLDLSKAFDTLDHQILLNKLNSYGIRGLANLWIKNYLMNRNQFVMFNYHSSSISLIRCGVPQGSILGPLLFLIYINDLSRCSSILQFIMFADDTNIIYSHHDPKLLELTLNEELKIISNWFKLNKLSLNIKKKNEFHDL